MTYSMSAVYKTSAAEDVPRLPTGKIHQTVMYCCYMLFVAIFFDDSFAFCGVDIDVARHANFFNLILWGQKI